MNDVGNGKEKGMNAETLARSMDTDLWRHFVPEDKKLCMAKENAAFYWLKADIEALPLYHGVSFEEVVGYLEELLQDPKYEDEEFQKIFHKVVHYDRIRKEIDIRADFAGALRRVKHGEELSSLLDYAFTNHDLAELARLHKRGWFRKKIEDLLTDCNFHKECSDFSNRKYEAYLKDETA